MSTLLDILRKLGILRYGSTKATYKNAKEMPDELLMPGVFNAKKDLIQKNDLGGRGTVIFWTVFVAIIILILLSLAFAFLR